MTYRELIVYILQNRLEDEEVFQNGRIPGFMTIEEAAVAHGVGVGTVKAWIDLGRINTIKLGNVVYVPSFAEIPDIRR